MPKIPVQNLPKKSSTVYPAPFQEVVDGRVKQSLGTAAGLTQFGVNLTELAPGAASALRHWHQNEDEFVYVLSGELTLIDDDGETPLAAGECAGFKAGDANGHHLVNRSNAPARYLEIGTRAETERGHYPDDDLVYEKNGTHFAFLHKDGTPYEETSK